VLKEFMHVQTIVSCTYHGDTFEDLDNVLFVQQVGTKRISDHVLMMTYKAQVVGVKGAGRVHRLM
jgi:hypothetical protein